MPDASTAAFETAPAFVPARPHVPEPSAPDATVDRAVAFGSVDAPAAPMSEAEVGSSAPPDRSAPPDPSAHAEPRLTHHAEEPLPSGLPPAASGCTTAQLRRFIKSRPWVPMHELRRRFGINGAEDDVAPVDVDGHRVFVGLPGREAAMLGELLRGGDVGVELSLDPGCPMVIGVYPMRPVPRG